MTTVDPLAQMANLEQQEAALKRQLEELEAKKKAEAEKNAEAIAAAKKKAALDEAYENGKLHLAKRKAVYEAIAAAVNKARPELKATVEAEMVDRSVFTETWYSPFRLSLWLKGAPCSYVKFDTRRSSGFSSFNRGRVQGYDLVVSGKRFQERKENGYNIEAAVEKLLDTIASEEASNARYKQRNANCKLAEDYNKRSGNFIFSETEYKDLPVKLSMTLTQAQAEYLVPLIAAMPTSDKGKTT